MIERSGGCWGNSPVAPADYTITVETTGALAGPQAGDFWCTLGEPCVLTLTGFDLSSAGSGEGSVYGNGIHLIFSDWWEIVVEGACLEKP